MKFVIGDVHGEITKLIILIDFIKKNDSCAEFIFVGDYLDKGENPKETLDYLVDLGKSACCHFLMGNHEYYWKKYSKEEPEIGDYLLKHGGEQTINSFQKGGSLIETKNRMLSDYASLFNQLIPYWTNEDYFISHSGIRPQDLNIVGFDDVDPIHLLFNRYDFLKMESYSKGKKVFIFGHTGFYTPFFDKYKIGVDTAACFLEKQPLTAFCLENRFFFNSNREEYNLNSLSLDCSPVIPRVKPWRIL